MKKVEVNCGDTYDYWEIIEEILEKWCNSRVFMCKCLKCGRIYKKRLDDLRIHNTKMCKDCNNNARWTKHGLVNHPLYSVFKDMHSRCEYEKHKKYYNCGARGIKVCDEWVDTVEGLKNFVKWSEAHGYKKGLQLDRFDNYKGYSPANCRYVTASVNNFNRRNIKGYSFDRGRWVAHIRKDGK